MKIDRSLNLPHLPWSLHLTTFSMTFSITFSMIFSIACEDASLPDFPEPMVRDDSRSERAGTSSSLAGEVTSDPSGVETNTGGEVTSAGTAANSGDESGGGDMAGRDIGGDASPTAGVESGMMTSSGGTTVSAGTNAGSSDTGGMMMWGTLSCSELLGCLESCTEGDEECKQSCATQGSERGLNDLNNLNECDQTWSCIGNLTCLSNYCVDQLNSCGIPTGEPGGSPIGGNSGGGSPTGGSMGGTTPSGFDLTCLEILECFGGCNNDDFCLDDCINRGSIEGITALSEIAACDTQYSCDAESSCLNANCNAELTRCQTGMPVDPVDPIDPTGPALSCSELLACFDTCAIGDQACGDVCVARLSPSSQPLFNDLNSCAALFLCEDAFCVEFFCSDELFACQADGQSGGGVGCTSSLDCDFGLICTAGSCVECATDLDCGLGFTCQSNQCVSGPSESCMPDLYEPNNTAATPTSSLMSELITPNETLSICGGDEDYYAFELCPEGTLSVTIEFDSWAVDLDLELFLQGQVVPELASAGVGDSEEVSWDNLSGAPQTLIARVFPYGSGESSYTLSSIISGCSE